MLKRDPQNPLVCAKVARSALSTLQWTYLITPEEMDCLTQLYRLASNFFYVAFHAYTYILSSFEY